MPPHKKSNSIQVDFSSLHDTYDVLPEGLYSAEITYAHLKTNKNNSGQYINWYLRIINNDSYLHANLFLITPLKPTALWKLKKLLKAIHFSYSHNIVDINLDDFAGKKLQVKVIQESYNGKIYNKIIDFDSLK